ncbi:menaquinone-dependent protoporphyrinogen IX dehydrogenase [Pasteurella atlantica]|uniref:Menaquinone-dependent protoporphyrinogen IX dehydrogenase n=3 Tax=Pasteurellales TaxID=135625 RepID=A0ACC6HNQ6_9PAST|nr:menaquinone-dependent protoporphyrinogen IX dehydrogenase [Pasteurella atlantica]MDP8052256.1 menaquinone-dependent protoporphyrinogen IX dehydrogenase [Pasteurella atlantica]MDP8101303.1 menaquinone-dependent protoporphyrinogen IX dehydrogenase [Pasteurella atlantica]MDP8105714.1 menaquinone-dependent protoporphyrinogen IX dehydrogenase [Pasteurella atlantica]MDP8107805.1 menaquinone-dependent protoporphyrinogen IX dehydrogenase [Pasteurella atlantica]MDP8149102.1 menaquinone-dependent pro
MKTIILYLTTDGQTQKIAEQIGQVLQGEVSLCSLRENTITSDELASFDNIIIGASIRYGRFDSLLKKFIQQHHLILNQKKSAFFSVNLTARKENKNQPETNAYTRKLLESIQWKPNWVAVFAGSLLYPKYSWYDRLIIQFIMRLTGGETDTSKEVEYTDWQRVNDFAQKFNIISGKM